MAVIGGGAAVLVLIVLAVILMTASDPVAPAPARTAPTVAVRDIEPAVTPPAPVDPSPTVPVTPSNEITNTLLGSSSYKPTSGNAFTLQNGRAIVKQPGFNTAVTYQLQAERTVFNDDRQLAAAIVTSADGGTGTFYELYVMKYEEGKAAQVGYLFLGDRIRIDALGVTPTSVTITFSNWLGGTYEPPITRTVTYTR